MGLPLSLAQAVDQIKWLGQKREEEMESKEGENLHHLFDPKSFFTSVILKKAGGYWCCYLEKEEEGSMVGDKWDMNDVGLGPPSLPILPVLQVSNLSCNSYIN